MTSNHKIWVDLGPSKCYKKNVGGGDGGNSNDTNNIDGFMAISTEACKAKKKKCIFLAISTEACKTPQKMGGGGFGNLNRGLQGHKKKEK